MIKSRRNKKSSNKTSRDKPSCIIQLTEGWNKINKVGIQPFFSRIENMDDEDKLQKISIDSQQYIEVYDTIFLMCIQHEPSNFSAPLYEKHSSALTKQLNSKFIPALLSKKTQPANIFLQEWDKRWRCNKWNVIGMNRMFMYLDRFHVPNSEDLLNTTEQGHTLYRQIIFEPFKNTAKNAILVCIQRERDGQPQYRDLLRDSITVFIELGNKLNKVGLTIYKEDFHQYLVCETKRYYKQKSRVQLDTLSCPDYLVFAETCINDEISRLSAYINKYSETDLMATVRVEILQSHQDELLMKKSGINCMLNRTVGPQADSSREDLCRLYRLYCHVPGGNDKIAQVVRTYITNLGHLFVEKSKNQGNTADPHELITQLIALHDRFLNIVRHEFAGEAVFEKALKVAFETFINKEYYVSALLARYANDLLKKGNKLVFRSSSLDDTIDHVVMLYGYIRDKDIFERDYQMYLASRLLQNLSESEQCERCMIGKLKTVAGYHWTSKLEDMFKDIQRSKELMDGFKKYLNMDSHIGTGMHGCELDVSVCTTGAWPDVSVRPVKRPSYIGVVSEAFKVYYLSRFNGKKLKYQMDKGKADVQVIFNARIRKILVVSTYQMLILLLFNHKKTITFKEMLDLSGIPKEELQVAVLSMAHPKIKVLRKAPNTKELCEHHKFQINAGYNNPKARVVIPTLAIKTKIDPNKVDPAIFTLRRHQMDAAVVRIMKARKTLKHQDLITEVVRQLIARFKPKGLDIKKRILSLIDLEYLERDVNDRQIYHYKQ